VPPTDTAPSTSGAAALSAAAAPTLEKVSGVSPTIGLQAIGVAGVNSGAPGGIGVPTTCRCSVGGEIAATVVVDLLLVSAG
jgi:hypothetical protein